MPLQLTAPIEKEFVLDKSDELFGCEGDPTRVTIKQATQAQHERRSDLWAEMTQEVFGDRSAPDSVRLIQRISLPELHRIEAYVTMTGSNILGKDGEPLFKFKDGKMVMTEPEFNLAWGKLHPEIVNEIHEKIIEVNPTWGPQGEAS